MLSIDGYAFYNCSSLNSVSINNSVTEIRDYAFSDCKAFYNMSFDGTVEDWKDISKGTNWKLGSPTKVYCHDGDVSSDGSITYN